MSQPNSTRRYDPAPSTLVLVVGVAGVGKSEFSKQVLRRVALTYIDKDTLTDSFFPETRTAPEYVATRDRIYDAMYRLVEDNLREGNSVLLDAPHVKQMGDNAWRERLLGIVSRTGACLRILRLVCSEDTLRNRLESRGLPRDNEKTRDWEKFRLEEPMWFKVPLEHRDICVEDVTEDHVEAAVRYVVGSGQADERNPFESLRVLWQGAVDSFNQRRTYEWRMCLAVWGALVGLIVAVVSQKVELSWWMGIGLLGSGFCFAGVLTFWIRKLQERNNNDRRIGDVYGDAMRKLAPARVPQEIEEQMRTDRDRRYSGRMGWNHGSQVAITWLLWATMALVVAGAATKSGGATEEVGKNGTADDSAKISRNDGGAK